MTVPPFASLHAWLGVLAFLFTFFSCVGRSEAQAATAANGIRYVPYTQSDGTTVWLEDNRKPALYTGAFGDCQGNSLINVTRFDAAYYADNMTVQFHLGGHTALTNESVMMYIGVFAYGQSRFDLTFDPCFANIRNMCPLNSSIPIEAMGTIPVAPSDVANIPALALQIPDFEGQAILRIFANSTQSQIACFSAVVTNGATFAHPAAIGSVLGVLTFVALVSSVAVAIYGHSVSETRNHYAHSLSVFVVFAVLQHIYFTGVLSMNWPAVLPAFWSNYAWAAGMIYISSMQNSINKFIGHDRGNISSVGSAASGQNQPGLGGGYQLSQIYKRSSSIPFASFGGWGETFRPKNLERALRRRDLVGTGTGFTWYGNPVRPGMPLPGNYSSFAGTLAEENIPASNAFLTGFIWLLILILLIAASMVALKGTIEGLARAQVIKTDRFAFFRSHWLKFTAAAVLRTCFIAFFMVMVLSMFQFTLGGAKGNIVLAAIVFVIFFIGMLSVAAYALHYRLRHQQFKSEPDRLHVRSKGLGLKFTPQSTTTENNEEKKPAGSMPWRRLHFVDKDVETLHVHDDEDYMVKFGWLASRFRRSKWWFFAAWLAYEFIRACFYGGAAGHPLTQVFGLLAVEIIALIIIVIMKPFESNRLNVLMVYILGFSKVATVALSSAFDTRFNLDRILTTVIGIVIIVIQGVLTICLIIAILVGAISSYMSITRYNEKFKPKAWTGRRAKYFKHIDQKATDKPAPPAPPPPPMPEAPKEPYFQVSTVRRQPKIEDEDADHDDNEFYTNSRMSLEAGETFHSNDSYTRTQSMRSRTSMSNLPYGAKRHRASWSTRDLENLTQQQQQQEGTPSRMSLDSIGDVLNRHQSSSTHVAQGAATTSRVPSRNSTPVHAATKPTNASSDQVGVERRKSRRNTVGTPHTRHSNQALNETREVDEIEPVSPIEHVTREQDK